LAHLGHRVTCVEKDEERIRGLKAGRVPIYEPGLERLVCRCLQGKRLSFAGSDALGRLVRDADVIFIAVDTPQGEDGSADLSNIAQVALGIGQALSETTREHPLVVVNKSTVPVGSGDYVSTLIREGMREPGGEGAAPFLVVSSPEFLREGAPSTTRSFRTGSWSALTRARP
jgi:UDPglucose 6-dehydrogenase